MRLPALATAGVFALVLTACGSDDTTTDDTTTSDTTTDDTTTDTATTDTATDGTAVATTDATSIGTDEPAEPGNVPVVVASTSIWADITGNVACGGLAEVQTIVPLGGDPHSFEPSLRDRETMERADLIVANGLFLEEGLADTIDAVAQRGVAVVDAADAVDVITTDDTGEDSGEDSGEHDDEHADDEHTDDGHDEGDEHDHGGADPHVWFDPNRVIQALPAIADGLAAAGVDAAALDACVADYTEQLTQLDADVEDTASALPVDQRLLVTNHDSLEYFADRYDFEVIGTVIPSSSSLAEANPADLEALATTIEQTGVRAIFTETQHSSADAEALADRVDVEVVELLTGTLDEPGTPAGDYVGWLRSTATTIVDALSG